MEITIKEIEKIQKPKEREQFWAYYFLRRVSKYITFFLLKINKNITPNQVTTFSLIWGLSGAILLSFPRHFCWILGCLIYIFFFIWDCVDGEIARMTKKSSAVGSYWDAMVHSFVNPAVLIFSSLGLYKYSGLIVILYLGIISGICIVILDILRLTLSNLKLIKALKKDIEIKSSISGWQNKHIVKALLRSFRSFEGFAILLFLASVIDFWLGFYYFRLFLLMVVYAYVILAVSKNIKAFLKIS